MRLSEGTKAPDFEALDWKGKPIRLSAVPGKRWLAFFRYASCPLCNLRVHKIVGRHGELLGRGLSVLAVFQSPPGAIARNVGKQEPPFPIIADAAESLYGLYGVETSVAGYVSPRNFGRLAEALGKGFLPGRPDGSATRVPADFLIDSDGTIRRAFYGKVIADHIPFEDVDAFIAPR
jgi:peroxiredoxin Q/BCP